MTPLYSKPEPQPIRRRLCWRCGGPVFVEAGVANSRRPVLCPTCEAYMAPSQAAKQEDADGN